MKIKDVMTKDIKAVKVPGNREDAVDLLKELEVSALPVLNKQTNELVGLVGLRELFNNPDETQLGMLVKRDVITIGSNESLEEGAKLMLEKNVRRLPVVDDGKLSGIITVRDILNRVIAEREVETPVSECMRNSVTTLWQSTPLNVALEILNLSGERALPVLDNEGRFVGMIGDEDIISVSEIQTEEKKELMRGRSETEKWTWDSEDMVYITKQSLKPPNKTVKDVMSKELITVTKRTTASKSAQLMKENNLNQLPVLAGKDLIGMISDQDILKVLLK